MSPEIRGGLADFFRNASEAQKKAVYEEVLEKATKAQQETLRKANEQVPSDSGAAPEAL